MIARRLPSFWVAALLLAVILVPTTLAASHGGTASTRIPYNDRRAPKPVRVVNVTAADTANVRLAWPATSDNVGVEGYGVYLNGSRASETASTTYSVRNLICSMGYTVGVDAFDAAGNRSRQRSTFVSTAACLDVTPPSAPSDVKTVAMAETSAVLSWAPSTDDFGVVGYRLYVGGFWVGQWSEPSATITNLSCGQNYTIGITAVDATGNTSPQTTAFFSTAPCADRMAPTSPTGLAVSKSTTTSVSLIWTASTDASGVAEYGLYKEGTKVDSATSTAGDFGGLECGRTYTFGVDAADAAQNRSAVATLSAATAPCPITPPPTTRRRPRRLPDDGLRPRRRRRTFERPRSRRRPSRSPGTRAPTRTACPATRSSVTARRSARAPASTAAPRTPGTTPVGPAAPRTTMPSPGSTRRARSGRSRHPPRHDQRLRSGHAPTAPADRDHTATAASPDDGLDGPDGAGEPPNDLGHADGRLARLGLEHRPGRHVRLPDLP